MDSRGTEGHQVRMNRTGMAAGGVEDGDRMKLDELPEQLINRYVIVLTLLDMTVRGLGILAFAWSTVVLLGGFVPFLERKDFWFITLISFTQSARIFVALVDEQYLHCVKLLSRTIIGIAKIIWNIVFCRKIKQSPTTSPQSHEESNEEHHACCDRFPSLCNNAATDLLIKIVLLIPLVLVVLLAVFVLFNIAASLLRLWQQDYGKEANQKPAAIIFYSIALCQGVLYFLWFILDISKGLPVTHVVKKCEFEPSWGTECVRRYLKDTKKMYLKDLLTATRGRNLVTYASSLLDSDYKEDYESGARILVVFIGKQKLPVEELIRSSRKRIQKLVMMLSWTDRDYQDTRLFAAKIVAHVARHISIAQFPGTLESIRSLLKPSESNSILFGTPLKSKPTTEEVRSGTEHTVQTKPGTEDDADAKMECQLIEQGLIILDQLSLDRTNCLEILKAEPHLMDILSWICSRSFIHDNEQEGEWVNILRLSFTVLAQLASLRGQLALKLLKKIKFEFNPSWVSGYARQPDIQILAIKTFSYVFTATAEDSSDAPEIKKLATTETSQQALPRGKSEKGKQWDKREHFLKFSALKEYCPRCANFYYNSIRNRRHQAMMVYRMVQDGTGPAQTDKLFDSQSDKQHLRLQAALVRIICDMQSNEKISGSEFSRLVGNRSHFAKHLKKLIVTNSRAGTDYHLEIVQWTAALIGSMLTRDRVWAHEIRKQGIVESLSDASKIMPGADSWMLYLRNHTHGAIWASSLAALVQKVQDQLMN